MKQDLNETGATVMVAPVVFTSVLLALALATLASATDETGDADQRDRAWSWHCEVEAVDSGKVGSRREDVCHGHRDASDRRTG